MSVHAPSSQDAADGAFDTRSSWCTRCALFTLVLAARVSAPCKMDRDIATLWFRAQHDEARDGGGRREDVHASNDAPHLSVIHVTSSKTL
jgi:hypothetical protein